MVQSEERGVGFRGIDIKKEIKHQQKINADEDSLTFISMT